MQLYTILQVYDQHYEKKINHTEGMLSKEDITVTQTFLHCMFEKTLGVQNIHILETICVIIIIKQ